MTMSLDAALRVPHLDGYSIHALLFNDVKNAPFLRQQLLAGNAEFEYAFIDATKILSVNHALAAVFRAANDLQHNRLKSRNVHSEIVFSLSPNNNIADSFRRYGIADSTSHVLAIKVQSEAAQDVQQANPSTHLTSTVEGTLVPFDDRHLQQNADLSQIRKLYKLDTPVPSKAGKNKSRKSTEGTEPSVEPQTNGVHSEVDNIREMEAIIMGIMALKGS